MSDAVLIALIATIAPTVAAVCAVILAIATNKKVAKVEKQTDGMREVLEEQAHQTGFEAGRKAVRQGDIEPLPPDKRRGEK
jgi:biopolymer transport protein ExbB/TolQ